MLYRKKGWMRRSDRNRRAWYLLVQDMSKMVMVPWKSLSVGVCWFFPFVLGSNLAKSWVSWCACSIRSSASLSSDAFFLIILCVWGCSLGNEHSKHTITHTQTRADWNLGIGWNELLTNEKKIKQSIHPSVVPTHPPHAPTHSGATVTVTVTVRVHIRHSFFVASGTKRYVKKCCVPLVVSAQVEFLECLDGGKRSRENCAVTHPAVTRAENGLRVMWRRHWRKTVTLLSCMDVWCARQPTPVV